VRELLEDTYMGREDFYEKMLRRFTECTTLDKLHSGIAGGDVQASFDAAHELKGRYATLGLTPAYEVCCRLVEKLRPLAGLEGAEELFAELKRQHDEIIGLIG